MKIVLNRCYGGFHVPDGFVSQHPEINKWDIARNDSRLVEYCEQHPNELKFRYSDLRVFEIPDEATDWDILEYDGYEDGVYVLDGKLNWI